MAITHAELGDYMISERLDLGAMPFQHVTSRQESWSMWT
jgi:hypothetical protein